MATSIDSLDIQISAKATSANNAINRLTKNLDKLSTSLNSLNVGNVKGLDKTLKSLANISNVSSNGATNITNLARALSTLSANANNIPILNRSLSGLSGSLARFMATMSVAPSVNSNTLQMTQALAQLSRAGNNASATASNLANLGAQLRNFMQIMSTAPMVNQNTIQMTNALANLASQGSRVGRSSQSLVSGLNRTDRAMRTSTKSAWSLARAFGKFYANYFLIIRGAKALWSSIESTADYIEAYNYFNVAFGKVASEWEQDWEKYGYENAEAYAESFTDRMNETLGKLSGIQIDSESGLLTDSGMKNLGLNIQEITQYASQLASVTNSLGQTGESTLAITQSMTKLAGDISSLFNVDYSTVAQNLQSGLIGQSRALYKYGIDITNATLQTYAYELGLEKAVSEMTQMEKQQLRVLAILDQSKVSWGDLANTINSPSNMIRQLTTNLKETGMVLGQLFIPMLENVLPVVNGTTIAIKRLLTEIAGFFGVEIDFEKFGQGYNELEDETSDLTGEYDDLASSIEEVQNQLLGFDEVNKLSDSSATLSVGTEDNTIDLTDKIVSATEEYQKVWDEAFLNMENTSQEWANTIGSAFGTLAEYLEPITSFNSENLNNFYNSFLKPLGTWTLGTGLPKLAEIFDDFMNDVDWDDLAEDLDKFYKGIQPFAVGFGQGFLNLLNGLAEISAGGINLLGDALELFGISLEEIGADNIGSIGEAFGILAGSLMLFKGLTTVGGIVDKIGIGFGSFFSAIKAHPYMTIIAAVGTLTAVLADMRDEMQQTEASKLLQNAEDLAEGINTLFDNLDDSIIDIEAQHTYYSEMATKYAQMSANYNNLTTEEKKLVKQYADELSTYAPGIKTNIDEVTGAWVGTTTELQEAIDKQAEFYKQQALEKAKSETYDIIAEAEISLIKTQNQMKDIESEMYNELKELMDAGLKIDISEADIGTGKVAEAFEKYVPDEFFSNILVSLGFDVDTPEKARKEWYKLVQASKKYYDILGNAYTELDAINELTLELAEPSGNINLGGIGIGAIFGGDITEAFDEYFDDLDKAKNESKISLNVDGLILGFNIATKKTENFKTKAEENNNVNLKMNISNFIQSLSSASGLYGSVIGALNSKIITPTITTAAIASGLGVAVGLYNQRSQDIENNKIKPNVDNTNVTEGFQTILNKYNIAFGNLTSKVKFEADKNSLENTATSFKGFFKDLKLTVGASITGVSAGALAGLGIQQRAMGGFVDTGQLFIAREAGPELVGTMGGHTTVANNQQITDGIARAVYSAFTSALATTNRGSGGDIVVNIDGKQVFKAVQRQANNYVAQTGQLPFNI